MTSIEWLDPEEFPFTEAELVAALGRWSAWLGHEALPRQIAQGLRECRVDRLRAAAAIARGSRDLEEINYSTFLFPDEVWALLADLSPSHADRVEAFLNARRAARRSHRLASAMHAAGFGSREAPTPEIIAAIDEEDRIADEQWISFRAKVRDEMRAASGAGPTDAT